MNYRHCRSYLLHQEPHAHCSRSKNYPSYLAHFHQTINHTLSKLMILNFNGVTRHVVTCFSCKSMNGLDLSACHCKMSVEGFGAVGHILKVTFKRYCSSQFDLVQSHYIQKSKGCLTRPREKERNMPNFAARSNSH